MRLIDEQYTRTPFYGWPRMTAHLRRQGLWHQSQTGAAVDAPDGLAGDLPQAPDERGCQRAQGVSVPAAQPGDHATATRCGALT